MNKYYASSTMYNGVRYASRAEARRAEVLDMMVRTGEIRFWIGQPKFRLGVPENVYVADFLVVCIRCVENPLLDNVWVEDVKGFSTPKFRHDVKLWKRYGTCPLHILRSPRGRSDMAPTVEVITPTPKDLQ